MTYTYIIKGKLYFGYNYFVIKLMSISMKITDNKMQNI